MPCAFGIGRKREIKKRTTTTTVLNGRSHGLQNISPIACIVRKIIPGLVLSHLSLLVQFGTLNNDHTDNIPDTSLVYC